MKLLKNPSAFPWALKHVSEVHRIRVQNDTVAAPSSIGAGKWHPDWKSRRLARYEYDYIDEDADRREKRSRQKSRAREPQAQHNDA